VVDAQGRIDPNAGHEIFFTVQDRAAAPGRVTTPEPHDRAAPVSNVILGEIRA